MNTRSNTAMTSPNGNRAGLKTTGLEEEEEEPRLSDNDKANEPGKDNDGTKSDEESSSDGGQDPKDKDGEIAPKNPMALFGLEINDMEVVDLTDEADKGKADDNGTADVVTKKFTIQKRYVDGNGKSNWWGIWAPRYPDEYKLRDVYEDPDGTQFRMTTPINETAFEFLSRLATVVAREHQNNKVVSKVADYAKELMQQNIQAKAEEYDTTFPITKCPDRVMRTLLMMIRETTGTKLTECIDLNEDKLNKTVTKLAVPRLIERVFYVYAKCRSGAEDYRIMGDEFSQLIYAIQLVVNVEVGQQVPKKEFRQAWALIVVDLVNGYLASKKMTKVLVPDDDNVMVTKQLAENSTTIKGKDADGNEIVFTIEVRQDVGRELLEFIKLYKTRYPFYYATTQYNANTPQGMKHKVATATKRKGRRQKASTKKKAKVAPNSCVKTQPAANTRSKAQNQDQDSDEYEPSEHEDEPEEEEVVVVNTNNIVPYIDKL